MGLFGNKKNSQNQDRITTEDLLTSMNTTRATIDPAYLTMPCRKVLEQYLYAYYTGMVEYLPYDKMSDAFYNKSKLSFEKDKNNGITKSLFNIEVKNVRPTNVNNAMMYMVSSVEFEIHYVVIYRTTHSTFDRQLQSEFKTRYEFISGANTPGKNGWILNKETDKREIRTEPFDLEEYQRQQQEYQRQQQEYMLQQQQLAAQAQNYLGYTPQNQYPQNGYNGYQDPNNYVNQNYYSYGYNEYGQGMQQPQDNQVMPNGQSDVYPSNQGDYSQMQYGYGQQPTMMQYDYSQNANGFYNNENMPQDNGIQNNGNGDVASTEIPVQEPTQQSLENDVPTTSDIDNSIVENNDVNTPNTTNDETNESFDNSTKTSIQDEVKDDTPNNNDSLVPNELTDTQKDDTIVKNNEKSSKRRKNKRKSLDELMDEDDGFGDLPIS